MIQLDVTIPGLEAFARRAALAPKEIENAEKAAVRRGITAMQARGKAHAAALGTGRLANSIQMEVVGSGLVGVVRSVAQTAISIEQGRQKGEHVKVGLILGWMNRKGIVADAAAFAGARQSVKTHGVVNRKKQGVAVAQRHLAWKIAMAIADQGTKPLRFLTPVVGESKADILRYFQEAIHTALQKVAGR